MVKFDFIYKHMSIDLLRLKERIEIAREMGESHFREFKSIFEGPAGNKTERNFRSVCQDIGSTLVAFSNADGGELLVGVEDNGEVSGVTYNENIINALLNASKTYVHINTPLTTTKATVVEFGLKKVVYFSVPKGSEYVYITSDGKCLQRKDLQSIPIPPEEIRYGREEKKSLEYDRGFVDNADINELDIDILTAVAREFSKTISLEKYLQHLELAEFDGTKLRLRKAALLLFAKDSAKWHPRMQVRILKINGNELKTGHEFNVIRDEEVNNNIINLIGASWDLLRPYLTETRFSEGALFKSQIIYPEFACREALINAIAHRDYSIEGRGIEVFVFDNRLEIKSPGELLSSITIKDIQEKKGVHQSRNSNVARVLREAGFMRELGEGFRRIFELMESNDLIAPDVISSNQSFAVKMHQKYVYTEEEKIWLENFKNVSLTREQKTVVRLGSKGELISAKMIWDAVGIVDTEDYRKLIQSLQDMGILISKISKDGIDKMRQKNQDRKSIPRFLIVLPQVTKSAVPKSTTNKHSFSTSITESKPKPKQKMNVLDDSEYAMIYIQNLPFKIKKDEILNAFSKYGEISEIRIPIDYRTRFIKGFAFIGFENQSSVGKALNDTEPIVIDNRIIYVRPYLPNLKGGG